MMSTKIDNYQADERPCVSINSINKQRYNVVGEVYVGIKKSIVAFGLRVSKTLLNEFSRPTQWTPPNIIRSVCVCVFYFYYSLNLDDPCKSVQCAFNELGDNSAY